MHLGGALQAVVVMPSAGQEEAGGQQTGSLTQHMVEDGGRRQMRETQHEGVSVWWDRLLYGQGFHGKHGQETRKRQSCHGGKTWGLGGRPFAAEGNYPSHGGVGGSGVLHSGWWRESG